MTWKEIAFDVVVAGGGVILYQELCGPAPMWGCLLWGFVVGITGSMLFHKVA